MDKPETIYQRRSMPWSWSVDRSQRNDNFGQSETYRDNGWFYFDRNQSRFRATSTVGTITRIIAKFIGRNPTVSFVLFVFLVWMAWFK